MMKDYLLTMRQMINLIYEAEEAAVFYTYVNKERLPVNEQQALNLIATRTDRDLQKAAVNDLERACEKVCLAASHIPREIQVRYPQIEWVHLVEINHLLNTEQEPEKERVTLLLKMVNEQMPAAAAELEHVIDSEEAAAWGH